MKSMNITLMAAAITLAFSNGALSQSTSNADYKADKDRTAASASKSDGDKNTSTPSKDSSAGGYVDDTVVTTKVKAAILAESTLKSAEINVETHKGVVQMTGFVNSRADINKAVAVARNVKGVTSVKNDMVVKGRQ